MYNENTIKANLKATVLFVDMNSFFASCEQQTNYWLRGRPVAVCVYTGKNGAIIAPSIEAKKMGVKMGLRLEEAMQICPELVPLETHPARYRDFHVKLINVLKKYSQDVIPRSIDEAVVDLTNYQLIYKDMTQVAMDIKRDIKNEVGDWLKCSIGIAPNAFLAKLASDMQKPDGLTIITPENIDEKLKNMPITDLPGIASGMAERLRVAGITTPLQLRYATPEYLKSACKSIIGLHWHYRLNFGEMDMQAQGYKSMQAMRQVSRDQRKKVSVLEDIFLSLCMTLEKRMVKNNVFAKKLGVTIRYEDGFTYEDNIRTATPQQDGIKMIQIFRKRMQHYVDKNRCEAVINKRVTSMGVLVTDFLPTELVQYDLFENNVRIDTMRKALYEVKDKHGKDKIMRASELHDEPVLKDVIGFGSVKDIYEGDDDTKSPFSIQF
jgi:DNA polymerase-4